MTHSPASDTKPRRRIGIPIALFCALAGSVASSVDAQSFADRVYLRGLEIDAFGEIRGPNGDPIGREEGDNGFRQHSPVLARGNRNTRQVDREALRRRRLELYAGTENTDPRTTPIEAMDVAPRPAPAAAEAPSSGPENKEKDRSVVAMIAGLIALLVGAVAVYAALTTRRAA